MIRRAFGGSRVNRDRREQSFARAVIARAEQLRREQEKIARATVDEARCQWCDRLTCLGDCPEHHDALDSAEHGDD